LHDNIALSEDLAEQSTSTKQPPNLPTGIKCAKNSGHLADLVRGHAGGAIGVIKPDRLIMQGNLIRISC
jgi:hypothetical protein